MKLSIIINFHFAPPSLLNFCCREKQKREETSTRKKSWKEEENGQFALWASSFWLNVIITGQKKIIKRREWVICILSISISMTNFTTISIIITVFMIVIIIILIFIIIWSCTFSGPRVENSFSLYLCPSEHHVLAGLQWYPHIHHWVYGMIWIFHN